MRALYAYGGAGLALAAGLVLVVATRSHLTPKSPAAGPPAAVDDGLARSPATPLSAPAPPPVEQAASFVYAGRLPHYVIKTDWKQLAEALPVEADATSYYLSPIHNPPAAPIGDAVDAAGHALALPIDIGEDAPPEATGDTRIGE